MKINLGCCIIRLSIYHSDGIVQFMSWRTITLVMMFYNDTIADKEAYLERQECKTLM